MKYILLFATFALTNLLYSAPTIVDERRFEPAAHWPGSFTQEPWWRAFLAMNQPEALSFQEWRVLLPASMLEAAQIDEAGFEEIKKEEAQKRKDQRLISRIRRVVRLEDKGIAYVAVEEAVTTADEPSEEFTRIQFFEKMGARWIVHQTSPDLANDELVNAIK